MNDKEVTKILLFISSSFPGKLKFPAKDESGTESLIETWLVYLSEIPFESAMIIAKHFCDKGDEWPPTPGQIAKSYNDSQKDPLERLTAEEAWGRLTDFIHRAWSKYKQVELEEKLPHTVRIVVRSMGGVSAIAYRKEDDPFPRKTFIETYNKIKQRAEDEPPMELLGGVKDDVDDGTIIWHDYNSGALPLAKKMLDTIQEK